MTKEDLFRERSQNMAKELAVACALLEQWNQQSRQPLAPGIAAPDFPAEPAPSLRFNIDRAIANSSAVTIEGWAFDPLRGNPPGASYAIFIRAQTGGWMAYPAASLPRPDVALHFAGEADRLGGLERTGFLAVMPRSGLSDPEIEIMIVEQANNGFWARSGSIRQRIQLEAETE